MGLFLSIIACKIQSKDRVIKSLIEVLSKRDYALESKIKVNTLESEIIGRENLFDIIPEKNGWVQIFGPEAPDTELAKDLSQKLSAQVFLFHIHDGDLWMYELFASGELKDRHNPIPEYWEKITEEERNSWRGNASILSSVLGVQEDKVSPYLVFWDELAGQESKKAFPDDEFPITSEWSMVDFQEKIGIIYPEFDNHDIPDVIRLTFKPTKKWWKFW